MTRFRKLLGVALAGALSLAIHGCASGGSVGEEDSHDVSQNGSPQTASPELPRLEQLSSPVKDGPNVPMPFEEYASESATIDAAHGGPTLTDAERFALLFTQATIDVRKPVNIRNVLEAVSAESLDGSVESAIGTEHSIQAEAKTGRLWRTDEPMWVRSYVSDGPAAKPSIVTVEVAGSVGSVAWADFSLWLVEQVRLERKDNAWHVAHFAVGEKMKDPRLKNPNLRHVLGGDGWRQVDMS